MMNPKALEALRQARALFAEKADDIPQDAQPVEPIRKPKVHLIPTNAPKFTKESMKEEHKAEGVARVLQENGHSSPKLIDAYVEMSVTQAVKACFAKGIKKPSDIAKETGKNVNQIYTAMWKVKQDKKKARAAAKAAAKTQSVKQPHHQPTNDDWDREPTPFEDAHMVVLHDRKWYEKEIEKLTEANSNLLIQIQELKTVIKYLERKVMV